MMRPTQVKVGHTTYSIHYLTEKKWLKKYDASKAGLFWVDDESILIRVHNDGDQRAESSLRETLLHEILHACWHHVNLGSRGKIDDDELEEAIVGTLSMPLIAVICDNPDVFDYIQSGSMVAHEGKKAE